MARLVKRLTRDYRARAVGLDVVFAEPEQGSGLPALDALLASPVAQDPATQAELTRLRGELAHDAQLAASIAGQPVVLGYVFQETPSVTSALPPPLFAVHEDGTNIPFIEAAGFTGNLPELQTAAAGGGFFDNPALDHDGVYRRVPILQRYHGALYESFALALARLSLGSPALAFSFHSGAQGPRDGLDLDWITLGDLRIPVDERATVLVPYRGPQGSFPHVSATDVLNGSAPHYPLQGAIVLVGTSAAGLRDTRVTPVGESFDGVEIHANLIAGMLDGRIPQHPRYVQGIELLQLAVIVGLVTWLMMRMPLLTACLGVLLVELVAAAVNLELWQKAGFAVPVASSMLLGVVLFVAQLVFGYFVE